MEQLYTLFLEPEPLQRIFVYMCRASTHDPISETARLMLTTPVQLHVSRFGLGLFKGCAVFPFSYMSKEQRQWLFELLSAMGGDQMHSALQAIDAPLEYTAENDRIFFKGDTRPAAAAPLPPASTASSASSARQAAPNHASGNSFLLDPRRVFDALLGAMHDSGHAQPERLRLLARLLLQRIGCQVSINRDLLMYIEGEMDRRFAPSSLPLTSQNLIPPAMHAANNSTQ